MCYHEANFQGYQLGALGGLIWMSESLYLQNKLKTTPQDIYFNEDMKSVFLHGKEINIWQLRELTSPFQLYIYYTLPFSHIIPLYPEVHVQWFGRAHLYEKK